MCALCMTCACCRVVLDLSVVYAYCYLKCILCIMWGVSWGVVLVWCRSCVVRALCGVLFIVWHM